MALPGKTASRPARTGAGRRLRTRVCVCVCVCVDYARIARPDKEADLAMPPIVRSCLLPLLLLLPASAAWAADAAAARTLVLVRHGHYTPDDKVDPKVGPGLSALGVAQARLAGARLAGLPTRFDLVSSSPMQRARDTSAVVVADLPGTQVEVVPDLAECTPPTRRASVMAGETEADLKDCVAQLDRVFKARFVPAAGGERRELLVAHGNVIRYLITRALDVDTRAWLEMSIGHTSLTTIRIAPDGSMQVIAAGDVGHLPPNLRTGTSADGERSLAIPAFPP